MGKEALTDADERLKATGCGGRGSKYSDTNGIWGLRNVRALYFVVYFFEFCKGEEMKTKKIENLVFLASSSSHTAHKTQQIYVQESAAPYAVSLLIPSLHSQGLSASKRRLGGQLGTVIDS